MDRGEQRKRAGEKPRVQPTRRKRRVDGSEGDAEPLRGAVVRALRAQRDGADDPFDDLVDAILLVIARGRTERRER